MRAYQVYCKRLSLVFLVKEGSFDVNVDGDMFGALWGPLRMVSCETRCDFS